jgi:hypothetical protein
MEASVALTGRRLGVHDVQDWIGELPLSAQ